MRGQLGFKTNLHDLYDVIKEVGRGANGIVAQVQHKASGRMFACKTIPKAQSPALTAEKQHEHIANIKREITVMKEMSSCLNVAKLEDVFEDPTHVHIVQELCLGGELEHSIGRTHYSERTARFPTPFPHRCHLQLTASPLRAHCPLFCQHHSPRSCTSVRGSFLSKSMPYRRMKASASYRYVLQLQAMQAWGCSCHT